MHEQHFQLIRASLAALDGRAREAADIFYRRLLQRKPELRALFRDDETVMRGKFANMLAVFGHAKRMDSLLPALRALGKRHGGYGAEAAHFEAMGEALWGTLTEILGARFTPDVEYAWRSVYADIAGHMRQHMGQQAVPATTPAAGPSVPENLLERIGGRDGLERVHRRFYRAIFDDAWLGRFFWGKDLETLVTKQTDFMHACLGGPNRYRGETPAIAHMHMFITDEIFDARQAILREAIEAEGVSPEVTEAWLQADGVFRSGLVKRGVDECVMRCRGQMPLVASKPKDYQTPR